jgi:branched-subunit amino acid transport protein
MARPVLRPYLPLLLAIIEAAALAYVLRAVSRFIGLNHLLPDWMGEAIHQTVLLTAFLATLLFEQPRPSRRLAVLAAAVPALVMCYDFYMAFARGWGWLLSAATAFVFGYSLYLILDEEAELQASNRAGRWHRRVLQRRREA